MQVSAFLQYVKGLVTGQQPPVAAIRPDVLKALAAEGFKPAEGFRGGFVPPYTNYSISTIEWVEGLSRARARKMVGDPLQNGNNVIVPLTDNRPGGVFEYSLSGQHGSYIFTRGERGDRKQDFIVIFPISVGVVEMFSSYPVTRKDIYGVPGDIEHVDVIRDFESMPLPHFCEWVLERERRRQVAANRAGMTIVKAQRLNR